MQDQYNLSTIQFFYKVYNKNLSSLKKINLNNIIEYTKYQFQVVQKAGYCKCGVVLLNDRNKYHLKPRKTRHCYRCGLMKRKKLNKIQLNKLLLNQAIKFQVKSCECGRFYRRNGKNYCNACCLIQLESLKKIKIKYEDEIQAKREIGNCEICGERKQLCVDHDHKTNTFRGLLCNSCNVGIGYFKDKPELLIKASLYIQSHRK